MYEYWIFPTKIFTMIIAEGKKPAMAASEMLSAPQSHFRL